MSKNPKKNYIDNKKLYDEIVNYRKKCIEHEEQKKPKPQLTPYIGECIIMIASNYASKSKFSGFHYRDEMISDAIENCIKYFDNFDPDKGKNPFAYFTQICHNAFYRRVFVEEQNRYIVMKNYTHNIQPFIDGHEIISGNDSLSTQQWRREIDTFMDNFEKFDNQKKEKRKKKKDNLDE